MSARVLSPSNPDVLALREAQASRAVLRPGARSAPPALLRYAKARMQSTRERDASHGRRSLSWQTWGWVGENARPGRVGAKRTPSAPPARSYATQWQGCRLKRTNN